MLRKSDDAAVRRNIYRRILQQRVGRIGAIAGGGKGSAIGAAVGGGAGTGAQVWTHGQQVRIPPETRLDFRLEQPLEITYVPGLRS